VYLPAIVGHVPSEVIRSVRYFLDFCYILRRKCHDEAMIASLSPTLANFHENCEIFRTSGVRPTGFSLPRQHSLVHCEDLIPEFGSPTGYCSSITEAKHITAVKEPWRRSNRNNPIHQMMQTNQRLDQLEAARTDFTSRGMLRGSVYMAAVAEASGIPTQFDLVIDEDDDGGPVFDPNVLADIQLAKRSRAYAFPYLEWKIDAI
ncbi:hypothetical protein BOTBODRAFT_106422, partial [Botryobasidium botryosum FD-172 SS1]